MRRGFLGGDLPCEKPCDTVWCPYNINGHCYDNAVCEEQTIDEERGGDE